METKKVNPQQMAKAAALRAGSDVTQLQAQRMGVPISGGAQFTAGSQSSSTLLPGAGNFGAQGVMDTYAPITDDWFWSSWMANAQKNKMQTGGDFQEAGVMPKLGKVFLPESFWAWAQAKQEQAFQEDFNRFVFSQVNVQTPEARAYWEKKFPGYTQQVYDAWATKMKTQAKMAEIQIKGFQNEADLWFAFLYQNGYFDRNLVPPTDRLVPVAADLPETGLELPFNRNAPITSSMPTIP